MKAAHRTPLERQLRYASRFALYSSMGVVALLVAVGSLYLRTLSPETVRMSWLGVDFEAMPAVRIFQDYLRINTAQPDANERRGAEYLASVLEAAGIPAQIEVLGGTHANLVAILEGESREALVLHNHIDTDPVTNVADWTQAPFSGAISSGYVYGRGAYDMKSVAVAQLMAMIDLKNSGRRPKRSVIFLATGTEEVGSDLGTKWILRHRPEITSRAWAFLTEGGAVETFDFEEVKYWGIETGQRRYVTATVCCRHREHLESLRDELLEERRTGSFSVRLTPEISFMLESYAQSRTKTALREALANPEALRFDAPAFFELPMFLRAMLRDDAVPDQVREAKGGDFELRVVFMLLPGSSFEAVRDRQLPAWRTAGCDVAIHDEGGANHGSPIDHPVYLAARQELEALSPGSPVGPYFLPWTATDSRFARAAGIPSYGFSPFLVYVTETYRIGQVDERMYLPAFVDGVSAYSRLVRRLVE